MFRGTDQLLRNAEIAAGQWRGDMRAYEDFPDPDTTEEPVALLGARI
jgi:hypothetical protein